LNFQQPTPVRLAAFFCSSHTLDPRLRILTVRPIMGAFIPGA